MIIKQFKDSEFEILIQVNEENAIHSVSLIKNNKQVEFQSNLDFETAFEIYDYYFDKLKGNDLSTFEGYEVK